MNKEQLPPVLYNTLYVGNLEFSATQQDLVDLLLPYGEVIKIYFPGSQKCKPRGYAFVQMKKESDVISACALNHQIFQGRSITVTAVRNPIAAVFPWNPRLDGHSFK